MRSKEVTRRGRVFGYARVSSEEQTKGSSLQDQQDAIQTCATARGLTVSHCYVESESAVYEKLEKREQMQALLRQICKGDLVLCDKLDRWSRDPEFTYRTMRELKEAGASVYFVGEQLDPTTSEGDSMLGMRVMFAREEHKRIKLRMVGTRKALRNRGYYAEGLTPLGYKRKHPKGHKSADKNVLQVDPVEAEIVRNIFARCIAGESVGTIREQLEEHQSFRLWDNKVIHHILHSRIYLGRIENSVGVWIDGQHDAIIDQETFDRAQAALRSRSRGGSKLKGESMTKDWLLRQVGVCGQCGAKISSAYSAQRAGDGYVFYYACSKRCGAPYMRVADQDAAIDGMALEQLSSLTAELAAGPEKRRATDMLIDYSEAKAKLERRWSRMLEAYADGIATKTEMQAAFAKAEAERARISAAEREQAKTSPLVDRAVRRQLLAHVAKVREAWAGAPKVTKRAILNELALSVALQKGEPPVPVWRNAEQLANALSVG